MNLESSDTVNLLGEASATGIYYVNETGDDTNNNGLSADKPFATISKAVSTIGTDEYSGGTFVVNIAPGIYQQNSYINLPAKDINFIGTGSCDKVVITGNGKNFGDYGMFYSTTMGVTYNFINLTLNNATANYGGAINLISTSNIGLFNCTVENNKAKYGGSISYFTGSMSVINSSFINNTATINDGGAIYTINGGVSVTGSCFVNNTATENGNAIYAKTITDVSGNWWGNNTPFSEGNKLIYDGGNSKYVTPTDYVTVNVTSSKSDFIVEFLNNDTGKALTNFMPARPTTLNSTTGVSINPSTGEIKNNIFTSTVNGPIGSNIVTLTVDNEVKDITVPGNSYYVNTTVQETGTGTITNPFKTIQEVVKAINETTEGTDFIVNIAPGEYNTTSTMTITKNVTFQKIGDGEVIINGQEGRIFTTPSDDGVYNIGFNNLTLTNATVTGNGAVLNIGKNGNVKVTDCVIENNTAKGTGEIISVYGGAIYVNNGNVTVTDSNFTNNTVNASGFTDSINGNSAGYGYGGAVYVSTGNVTVTGSSFTNNTVNASGSISDMFYNQASAGYGYGGAVYVSTGNVTVTNSSFTNNTVSASSSQSNMYKGTSYGYGGAVYVSTGNVTVKC